MLDVAKVADVVHEVVRGYVSKSQAPVLGRLAAVEARASIPGPPGESVKGDPGEPADRSEIIALTQEVAELRDQLTEMKRQIAELLARAPVPGAKGDQGESIKGDPGESIEGPEGKPGRGIADTVLGEDGTLTLFFTDATTKNIGRVRGREGVDGQSVKGDPGPAGKDGLGFEHMDGETDEDDGRIVVRRYKRGDEVKEFRSQTGKMIYRGVFKEGNTFKRGDTVTFGGSLWHCNEETGEKPGDGAKCWVLAAKRGRDGKDGEDGKKGDPGAAGRVVREYGA